MTDRAKELEAAADAIDPASLQAAKAAMAASCVEYIRWAELFSQRLETVEPSELHKFARALVLTMLGHLPTRPVTCPFCIQYGRERSCRGCGYGATHGRCDAETSAFSRFIEAFQELGRVIYQDVEGRSLEPGPARGFLLAFLRASQYRAERMQDEISGCNALQLMKRKTSYLGDMIEFIPVDFFSQEVTERRRTVMMMLMDYW